jgi:hypothetical protein
VTWNSTFKKPGKRLERSPFKKQLDRNTQTLMRKAAIKTKKKRVPGVCRLNPVDDTVVPCHSNQSRHGKAGGLKADNEFTVPGCNPCHGWIDQNRVGTPKQVKFDVWDAAYELWAPLRARKMGLELQEAV